MSYNILAQATIRKEVFWWCKQSLKWNARKKLFIEELALTNADIMCFQV
jgi:mRNA deadenylase 3'-5' endonuclease subunit Ccr4